MARLRIIGQITLVLGCAAALAACAGSRIHDDRVPSGSASDGAVDVTAVAAPTDARYSVADLPGVFGSDHIHRREDVNRSPGDIGEITDRGGNHVQ